MSWCDSPTILKLYPAYELIFIYNFQLTRVFSLVEKHVNMNFRLLNASYETIKCKLSQSNMSRALFFSLDGKDMIRLCLPYEYMHQTPIFYYKMMLEHTQPQYTPLNAYNVTIKC